MDNLHRNSAPGNVPAHVLPFGRHKGKRPDEVASGYLTWMLRECKLSSGLRDAIATVLRERGQPVPQSPPRTVTVLPCSRCRASVFRHTWAEDAIGRRWIRRECRACGSMCGHAPHVEPFLSEANATASPTPVLDVLTRLADLGIELESDGRRVRYAGNDWHKVPPDLRRLVLQCNHTLAGLLGDTRVRDA